MDDRRPELSWPGGGVLGGARSRATRVSPAVLFSAALVALLALVWALPPRTSPRRFSATFDSPEALGREVLRALEAKDLARLRELPLGEREFKEEVWPEMPAARGVPAAYAWQDLAEKSTRSLRRSLALHGGRHMELAEVRFMKGATAYSSFVVHRRARLVVREGNGRLRELDVLGSVLQDGGRYKLFSYVVDR